jgi:TonB family protein
LQANIFIPMPFKYLIPAVLLAAMAPRTPVSDYLSFRQTAVADSNIRPVRVNGDTTFYENGFAFIETHPAYPGGWKAVDAYISDNIHYPKAARKARKNGTVRVRFTLDTTGQVTNVRALDSLGYGLEEEASRVISQMPPWIPGRQQGKPVKVEFTLPIKFYWQ